MERLAPGGVGVVRTAKGTSLLRGVAADELVDFEVIQHRDRGKGGIGTGRGGTETRVLKVLEPSPDRVVPSCPVVDACGGCDFMHLSDEAQSRVHAEIVEGVLAHAISARPSAALPEVRAHRAPLSLGYRTRTRFLVKGRGKSALVGYRKSRSHDLIEIGVCGVLDARLAPALGFIRKTLEGLRDEAEVDVALGERDKIVLSFRFQEEAPPALFGLLDQAVKSGEIAGARVLLEGSSTPASFGDPRAKQIGADDKSLSFGSSSFAQASEAGARTLANLVREIARPEGKKVVELFAGSGTLSVLLAPGAASFTAVEVDKEAVLAARENLTARGLEFKCVTADANEYVIPKVDLVILDPPRSGAKGATLNLAKAKPKRIVYVSCDATTLARDVTVLSAAGYSVTSVDTLELFPQTSHVEIVVGLELLRPVKGAPAPSRDGL